MFAFVSERLTPFAPCCCARYLGLDGIDHLGLGGALRAARTVLRYGIHTWHHCRYARTVHYPHPLFCAALFFSLRVDTRLQFLTFLFAFLLLFELYRIWIICARIRHDRSTSRSKSRSPVTWR